MLAHSLLALLILVSFARSAAAEDCAPYYKAWSFRTASPISSPVAVDSQGQSYIATHEGYLHGLGEDGRFLWSYTVKGALLAGVVVDDRRRVYAVSSEGIVYALTSAGEALWVFHSPVTPEGGFRVTERHALHFYSGYYLYAISSRAGLLWRAPLGSHGRGEIATGARGESWLLTRSGKLHAVTTPYKHQSFELDLTRHSSIVGATASLVLIQQDDELLAFDRDGKVRWRVADVVEAALVKGQGVVTTIQHHKLTTHRLSDGSLVRGIDYEATAAAPPLGVGQRTFIPRADGVLDVVEADGVIHHCAIAEGALMTPVAATEGRIVVSSGSGVVVGLSWMEPEQKRDEAGP